MPHFARPGWKTAFLPTAYAKLGSSTNPFQAFTKGPHVVKDLQVLVDLVYGDSGHKLVWPEEMATRVRFLHRVLFTMLTKTQAIDRLNEMRSKFGARAIKIVDKWFETPGTPYYLKPAEISKYARWAVRQNGPAIFAFPTPEDCTVSTNHPNYVVCFYFKLHTTTTDATQAAQGIFESNFVLDVMSAFRDSIENAVGDRERPTGALALTGAAVSHSHFCCNPRAMLIYASLQLERAFGLWDTGYRKTEDVKQFSSEHSGKAVGEYVFTLGLLSDRRWGSIMEKVFPPTEDEPISAGPSSLAENRRNLYIPSSP